MTKYRSSVCGCAYWPFMGPSSPSMSSITLFSGSWSWVDSSAAIWYCPFINNSNCPAKNCPWNYVLPVMLRYTENNWHKQSTIKQLMPLKRAFCKRAILISNYMYHTAPPPPPTPIIQQITKGDCKHIMFCNLKGQFITIVTIYSSHSTSV